MGQTLAHADRVDRSKRESHWASWENSLGVGRKGERASARGGKTRGSDREGIHQAELRPNGGTNLGNQPFSRLAICLESRTFAPPPNGIRLPLSRLAASPTAKSGADSMEG